MALSCMFIYCYVGNIVTVKCFNVSLIAYQSLWYRYPTNLQFYVMQIIRFSQKPFYLSGYGVMRCSLESFTSVSLLLIYSNVKYSFIVLLSFLANEYISINVHAFQKCRKILIRRQKMKKKTRKKNYKC